MWRAASLGNYQRPTVPPLRCCCGVEAIYVVSPKAGTTKRKDTTTDEPLAQLAAPITERLSRPAIERVLLGTLLMDSEASRVICGWLQPEHFEVNAHALIYEAMQAVTSRDEPTDLATVAAELRRRGQIDQVGALAFLGELMTEGRSSVYAVPLAHILIQTSAVRSERPPPLDLGLALPAQQLSTLAREQ